MFGLGTLVVYLTLSAQYESFVLPFIVLLAVPMALLGALSAQWLRGLQNDVFCQVGLVMLVGLSSKNAILIVEFAEQLRERGVPLVESAVQAATIRLCPILMTSASGAAVRAKPFMISLPRVAVGPDAYSLRRVLSPRFPAFAK